MMEMYPSWINLCTLEKTIPGTASYWHHKKAELYSWINHHVEQGRGAPSIFMTLSCAEYFWPDIWRLLQECLFQTTRKKTDLNKDYRSLNQALNDFAIIVQVFFSQKSSSILRYYCQKTFRHEELLGKDGIFKAYGINSYSPCWHHWCSNKTGWHSIPNVYP